VFPIYNISDFPSYRLETLGTKEKFWVQPPLGHELKATPHLFKIGRPGTGVRETVLGR